MEIIASKSCVLIKKSRFEKRRTYVIISIFNLLILVGTFFIFKTIISNKYLIPLILGQVIVMVFLFLYRTRKRMQLTFSLCCKNETCIVNNKYEVPKSGAALVLHEFTGEVLMRSIGHLKFKITSYEIPVIYNISEDELSKITELVEKWIPNIDRYTVRLLNG
jgi:hypothetical protein